MPRDVENKAIALVVEYERKQGRNPRIVSRTGCGYDIKSENRCIEVKGQSMKNPDFIYLYKKTLAKLGADTLNYYIYVVYDINNKPKLKILPPEKIFGNIEIEPMFLIRGKVFRDLEDIEL